MSWSLERVLLRSVGPRGARYEDVLLDLRDADGDPASRALLLLINGGGKGVLMKLIFSVLLPSKRDTVGADATTRTLGEFVSAADTSHVALEWRRQGEESPLRLITGKALEWEGQSRSSDLSKLRELWYCLYPTDLLGIESLPTHDGDGRPARLRRFKDLLSRAEQDDPALELRTTDRHIAWREQLADLGLDGELFRYQGAMNAVEGGAARLFKDRAGSAQRFVDFFIEATHDEGGLTELVDLVDQHEKALAQRDQMALERRFFGGLADRLEPIAQEDERLRSAIAHRERAERRAQRLRRDLEAGAELAEKEAQRLETEAGELTADLNALRRELDFDSARLGAVREHLAEFRVEEARASWERAHENKQQADSEAEAWRLSVTARELRGAEARAQEARSQLEAVRTDAAPLRERLRDAANDLRAALVARVSELAGLAAAAAESARTAATEAVTAETQIIEEARSAAAAHERASELVARAERAEQRLEGGRDDGDLPTGTSAGLALRGVREQLERFELAREAAREEATERATQQEAVEAQLEGLRGNRGREEARQREGERRLEELSHRATELLDRLLSVECLEEDEAEDLWEVSETARSRLREKIARYGRERSSTALDAQDVRATLEHLDVESVLPADRELERACESLQRSGVAAVPAWRFLRDSVPRERWETLIVAAPALVSGVVITDPSQWKRAVEMLRSIRPRPRRPIAALLGRELLEFSTEPTVEIAAPAPALYDETLADSERASLEPQAGQARERIDELERSEGVCRGLLSELDRLLTDAPAGLGDLRADARAAAETAEEQRERENEAKRRLERIREEQRAAQRIADERAERTVELTALIARLEALAEAEAEAESTRRHAAKVDREARAASAAEAEHRRRRDDADGRRVASAREAEDLSRQVEELRSEAGGIAAADDDEREPPAESLERLRELYVMRLRSYHEKVGGEALGERLRAAEERVEELGRRLQQSDEVVVRRAHALCDQVASSEAAVTAGIRRTERLLEDAVRSEAGAERRLRDCEEELSRQRARERPRERTGDLPTTVEEAEDEVERLTAAVSAATTRRSELDKEVGGRRRLAEAQHNRARSLNYLARGLPAADPDDPADAVEPFEGPEDDADARASERQTALAAAQGEESTAKGAVETVCRNARSFCAAEEFASLETVLLAKVSGGDDHALCELARSRRDDVALKAAELEKELQAIERRRESVLELYGTQVSATLKLLRRARSASRMPEGLGGWSGREFLRIEFDAAEGEALRDRLGVTLTRLIEEGSRRDGLSLLLRGTRAAMGERGPKVSVLKPDQLLSSERVPIERFQHEFSGGEGLSAAIALYCTLASLRHQSQQAADGLGRWNGTLFLDNPIGVADASYLLNIQSRVAARMGVQLVYTTGVREEEVMDFFPVVLSLRNDREVVSGLRHVRVEDELRRSLLRGRAVDGNVGTVDVVRLARDGARP